MIDALAVIAAIGTILTAVVAAGVKGTWVWGRELQAERTEKLFWRDVALRSTGNTGRALSVGEHLATAVVKPDDG